MQHRTYWSFRGTSLYWHRYEAVHRLSSIPPNSSLRLNLCVSLWSDFCSFTLDPNTVEKYILLSEEGRVATYKRRSQKYPEHPERFEGHPQVLCRERVSGFCYWEVKWSGRIVNVAISYKEVPRKGRTDECGFGRNQQSWKLCCSQQGFSFWHDNSRTDIPIPPGSSSIVGVFVNHRAGRLAFYSVSGDTVTLLHRVKTTFSQPLYPGFWVGDRSSVKICVE
uniref:B30.2/SPRY domain-containing protein n=1 Tax=Denticeps clupeoides TaxID=299321 RepID=A0AAY4B7D6_9TELE